MNGSCRVDLGSIGRKAVFTENMQPDGVNKHRLQTQGKWKTVWTLRDFSRKSTSFHLDQISAIDDAFKTLNKLICLIILEDLV